jgi:hypothetical protein
VRRDVGVHRADDGEIVGVRGSLGEHLAHLELALAVLGELERRTERDVVAILPCLVKGLSV